MNRPWILIRHLNNGSKPTQMRIFEKNDPKQVLLARAVSTQPKPETKKKSKPAVHSASFVQNLFRGLVESEQIFPYPQVLNEEEKENLSLMKEPFLRFMDDKYDPLAADAQESVPDDVVEGLKELGAFGMTAPAEYGGIGLTNTQYARSAEDLGGHDLALGIFLGAHQSIGYKGIVLAGNEEQKQKYLFDLTAGKKLAAFALTEPSSGSDAGSIKSRAELSKDGKHYVLNGSKIWISNGGLAEIFTVFAQVPVLDEKTGTTTDKVTAFIVERSFGGVTNGNPEKKMGIKASNTTEVYFDNVKIPVENVLGGPGNGFKVAMQILNNGRFGMCAALSGNMRKIITRAVEHATQRTQFGSKIDSYGAIMEKIARMSMIHYTVESMAYIVSGTMDRGYKDYQLEAAISKVLSSEAAWFVTDEAIQIFGGMGYMREAGLEKNMRDLRIFRIFEGTNDILRLFIALTGIQYAGGHLKELQKAVSAPVSNFGVVLNQVAKRGRSAIGFSPDNVLADKVHANLVSEAADVCIGAELFGSAIEKLLIKHGKNIINEQFLLNRIAEGAIDLFSMACVLSRCTQSLNQGLQSARHEELITKTFCYEAYDRIKTNVSALSDVSQLESFKNMADISKAICSHGSPVQGNPIGVN